MKIIKGYYQLFTTKIASFIVCNFYSLELKGKVIFNKIPYILIHKEAIIMIGDQTRINSSNYGYHINMYSKCKLYADRANALIKIGEKCRIHGACIHAYKKIVIGNNCLIAANTQIIDANGHQLCMEEPEKRLVLSDEGKDIIIEDNVWIAANCIILGGTHIGEGSVITAGSIVKGIVPAKSIYGGNPAKLIKQY